MVENPIIVDDHDRWWLKGKYSPSRTAHHKPPSAVPFDMVCVLFCRCIPDSKRDCSWVSFFVDDWYGQVVLDHPGCSTRGSGKFHAVSHKASYGKFFTGSSNNPKRNIFDSEANSMEPSRSVEVWIDSPVCECNEFGDGKWPNLPLVSNAKWITWWSLDSFSEQALLAPNLWMMVV